MLYLFDLDGSLIENFLEERDGKIVSRYAFPYERVEVLPDRHSKLIDLARSPQSRFAICTNQGGVALGFQTPREVWTKMGLALAALDWFYRRPYSLHVAMHAANAKVKGYDSQAELARRKPRPGMLFEALQFHGVEPDQAIYIGDMESDLEAAQRAEIQFEWAEDFFSA